MIRKNHRFEELNIEREGLDDLNRVGEIMEEIREIQKEIFDDAYRFFKDGQKVYYYGHQLVINQNKKGKDGKPIYQERIRKRF